MDQIQADDFREWRDKVIWSTIQMGKSIGLGWLMQTNSLEQAAPVHIKGPVSRPNTKRFHLSRQKTWRS